MNIKQSIRSIVNWPQEGVIFRDLTTLMKDPKAYTASCDMLYERYKDKDINKVVGIDARGFVFGAVLAYKLGVGFIPIRKKGKLPSKTIEAEYELEYGTATVELHRDAISTGERILIVDDLIATGGTIAAAVQLVRELGGNIIECAFIVELPEHGGRKMIPDCEVFALVEFEGE